MTSRLAAARCRSATGPVRRRTGGNSGARARGKAERSAWMASTRAADDALPPRTCPAYALSRARQAVELCPHLVQRGLVRLQPRTLVCHHRRRRATDERRIGELFRGLGDIAFQSRALFAEAGSLRHQVNFNVEHEPVAAD